MEKVRKDFFYSELPEPHRQRTKEILKDHPEVRNLIGRNPYSLLLILFVISLQILISILLTNQPWWIALLVAYLVGAFANHSLFVLVHETAHNLIFKNKKLNFISGIIADIPNVVPSSISF
jgi:sphingolipid delta-4 desaturase